MPSFEPEFPKPYELVSFPGKPDRGAPQGHDRYDPGRITATLQLRLIARRPVQVGSGFTDFTGPQTNQRLATLNATVSRRETAEPGPGAKLPVLPGSSLKGAIRSVLEAISRSCVAVVSRPVRSAIPRALSSCGDSRRLCPACRLFGMSGRRDNNHQGLVSVEDALAPAGSTEVISTPLLWSPARGFQGLPNRYLRDGVARGRKIYYHGQPADGADDRLAIKAGTELPSRIHVENLSDEEMGLLLTALGLHPQHPFLLKVGAAKPIGMGSIEVQLERVQLRAPIHETGRLGGQHELTGEQLMEKCQQWAKAAESLLDTEALKELEQVLKRENLDREMPSGTY